MQGALIQKKVQFHFRENAGAVSRLIHFGDEAYTPSPPFFPEPFSDLLPPRRKKIFANPK